MFEIPTDLAPECAPLAWLLGTWRGEGVGGYPTIDDFRFEQEVTFTQNGKQYVTILSGIGGLWWNAARQQLQNVPQGGSVWTSALID